MILAWNLDLLSALIPRSWITREVHESCVTWPFALWAELLIDVLYGVELLDSMAEKYYSISLRRTNVILLY